MSTRVCQTEARERATQGRVPMRRPLSLEVGKERHAVGTGWHVCRLRNELRVSTPPPIRHLARALIPIPAKRPPGRQANPYHIPHVGGAGTEGARTQLGVPARVPSGRRYG